ncbi:MAG: plastocyanin/azurin family copper-binding protein [Candidatus Bathyarchaeota archaeon]|nr:plastocyanin/azurin family copper-binding protein [Candidatus Bathyarchaeota archaeon]
MSSKSRRGLYAAIIIIVIIIIVVGVYVALTYKPSSTPSAGAIQVTLYAGEVSSTTYGFGNTSTSITSPGPTLTFKQGQEYTVTVHNDGALPHSWEINTQNSTSGQVLFNSEINPGTYISPGQSGSVTFTPTQTGNFYYICPVPGHAELGMWGNVVVTP